MSVGDDVVYSTLSLLDGAPRGALDPFIEMATLWAAHLRGPGRFDGRVILLTNVPDLPAIPGVEFVLTSFDARDRSRLFMERVRHYRAVPSSTTARIMQLDLDALAIAPLAPLLARARAGRLLAARSGWSPLVHDHAGQLLTRPQRWRYRLAGWSIRAGVSACVTLCHAGDWIRIMRRWAAGFRARPLPRPPQLGDQAYLNWLFLTGALPVHRLPGTWVHHLRTPGEPSTDPAQRRATILHFPIPNKLREMRRLSRV